MLPEINQALCTGCGHCVTYCPTQAVELQHGAPVIVRPTDCAYCALCEETCPTGAIQLSYEIHLADPQGEK
jgi:NAD-dependent dihydropyrimidine dehydrogenase PreA subunit